MEIKARQCALRQICVTHYLKMETHMPSPGEIAKSHFEAALAEAIAAKIDADTIARYTLSLVLDTYLKSRSADDVRAELEAACDHLDPDEDFMFMRP